MSSYYSVIFFIIIFFNKANYQPLGLKAEIMHFSSVEDDQFPGGFVFKTML